MSAGKEQTPGISVRLTMVVGHLMVLGACGPTSDQARLVPVRIAAPSSNLVPGLNKLKFTAHSSDMVPNDTLALSKASPGRLLGITQAQGFTLTDKEETLTPLPLPFAAPDGGQVVPLPDGHVWLITANEVVRSRTPQARGGNASRLEGARLSFASLSLPAGATKKVLGFTARHLILWVENQLITFTSENDVLKAQPISWPEKLKSQEPVAAGPVEGGTRFWAVTTSAIYLIERDAQGLLFKPGPISFSGTAGTPKALAMYLREGTEPLPEGYVIALTDSGLAASGIPSDDTGEAVTVVPPTSTPNPSGTSRPPPAFSEVQPILASRCASAGCHSSGGINPAPLQEQSVVMASKARVIERVGAKTMPPKGTPQEADMTDAERDLLLRYLNM